MGSPGRLAGADAVAGMFNGRALGAQPALVNGAPGLVWIVNEHPKVAWEFIVEEGRVSGIDMLADPDTFALSSLELTAVVSSPERTHR